MFEYMFFDEELRQQFIAFARDRGVECSLPDDGMGLVAAVAEDVPDRISDDLDTFYDKLLEQQADLVDQAEGNAMHQAAGIRVTLSDGSPCMVRLDPAIANRLLAAFTLEEMQTLVQSIARSMENPGDGPVCKR